MHRHVDNARQIARFLRDHPKVKAVFFPEFHTGGQKAIVDRQMQGPGAIISVELQAGYDTKKFLASLQYFPLAESLGGVESLIDHPASMTHASIPKTEREKIGLSDELLRISVGIENPKDLLDDLEQALQVA
jgi:cystathionine beta-lyase/cystathionine gamma-synthase